ncbi:MAG TPA: cobalamin-binding protein, partial [Leptospiraceae bacterium]|nr:cobalamin-binding protein [Leptospiraceae bacterium]
GNVHEIDSSIILQPGPALFLEGVDALARAIFNERLHQ